MMVLMPSTAGTAVSAGLLLLLLLLLLAAHTHRPGGWRCTYHAESTAATLAPRPPQQPLQRVVLGGWVMGRGPVVDDRGSSSTNINIELLLWLQELSRAGR